MWASRLYGVYERCGGGQLHPPAVCRCALRAILSRGGVLPPSPVLSSDHPPIHTSGRLSSQFAPIKPPAQVRLFLEYCDRGTLRDALSGFAFMGPGGFNYKVRG